eukprot:Nitzschia sp. Nitz4//scaffold77_size91520//11306//15358//NITZ4_004879-RA/size91520-processed-gene-0.23-mRNA-1//1//CDS//3329557958//3644//frame0
MSTQQRTPPSNWEEEQQKWLKIAANLEKKLKVSQAKYSNLQRTLSDKNLELEDLQFEYDAEKDRVHNLELQCIEKSEKLASLSSLLETRGTNETQELLLKKSMEHTEAMTTVNHLQLELQKAADSREKIVEENTALKQTNNQLTQKVEETSFLLDKMKREYDRNSKLLLELGDIVRTLNCVTVSFDVEDAFDDSPHANPIKNIKRKVQAMEDDRLRLQDVCTSLQKEVATKDRRIYQLERQQALPKSHSVSTTEHSTQHSEYLERPLLSQTSPVSIDTEELDHAENDSYDEESTHRSDREGVESNSTSSSFSSLDPPDVPIEEFEALKQEYEQALERIVSLSAEVGKAKAAEQELLDREEQYAILHNEKEDAEREIKRLNDELEDALNLADQAAAQIEHVKAECQEEIARKNAEVEEIIEEHEAFRVANRAKLAELEKQVISSAEFFEIQREGIKQQHANRLTNKDEEVRQLQEVHAKALAEQEKKFDDLQYEYETFLEMHNEMEDDLNELREKFDEALTKIVELEDQLEDARGSWEKEKCNFRQNMEHQSKETEELQEAAQKSKSAMQDSIVRQQKLRKDYEKVLAQCEELREALKHSEERCSKEGETINELKDNCCYMESRLRKSEKESFARYENLHLSYQKALCMITYTYRRLYSYGLAIADGENEDLAIGELLRLQEGYVQATVDPDVSSAVPVFKDDITAMTYCIRKEKEPRPFWLDRCMHQVRLWWVHQQMCYGRRRDDVKLNYRPTQVGVAPLYALFQHQERLRQVHEALRGVLTVSQSRAVSVFQTSNDFLTHMKRMDLVHKELGLAHVQQHEEPIALQTGECGTAIDIHFLYHQRKLSVVLFDIISHARILNCATAVSTRKNAGFENIDTEMWRFHGPGTIEEAKFAVRKLKGEARQVKLIANTARIRFEAREKEHRVVLFQYKKLLEEYSKAVKEHRQEADECEGVAPRCPTEQSGMINAELERLKRNLRAAELRVETMVQELKSTKAMAEEAQEKQAMSEKKLEVTVNKYESLEAALPACSDETIESSIQRGVREVFRGSSSPRGGERSYACDGGDTSTLELLESLDESLETSAAGVSTEGRDETGDRERVRFESGFGKHLRLQRELSVAQRRLEETKRKHEETEILLADTKGRLRDREEAYEEILNDYKELQVEYDILEAQLKDIPSKRSRGTHSELLKERDMALAQIELLREELESAKTTAKLARNKQKLREDHLRQVIGQYKELEQKHSESLEKVQMLKGVLKDLKSAKGASRRCHDRSESSEISTIGTRGSNAGKHCPKVRLHQKGEAVEISLEEMEEPPHGGNKTKPWLKSLRAKLVDKKFIGKRGERARETVE